MCFSFCKIDKYDLNCGLGISSLNSPNNKFNDLCSIEFQYGLDFYLQFFTTYEQYFTNQNVVNECEKMCPLECKTQQYDLSIIQKKNMETYQMNLTT